MQDHISCHRVFEVAVYPVHRIDKTLHTAHGFQIALSLHRVRPVHIPPVPAIGFGGRNPEPEMGADMRNALRRNPSFLFRCSAAAHNISRITLFLYRLFVYLMEKQSTLKCNIMSIKILNILTLLMFLVPAAQAAEDLPSSADTQKTQEMRFMFPVSCSPGEDCWAVNYDDSDPAEGSAEDYTCGPQTYDGHDGTDFAVRDEATMKSGVDVLSAAAGKIMRVRDEIEDKNPSAEDMEKMRAERKGCGNGVLIDHGGGWQTIYCHLKKGSIIVKEGETVATGQKIGQIGQSGMAEFPHLHFGALHDGKIIDPFTGLPNDNACGRGDIKNMWLEGLNLDYEPFILYAAGFDSGAPDFESIKKNAAATPRLPLSVPALTFWVAMFNVREGDKITLTIADPAGTPFATRDIVQDKTRARQFYFVGKKMNERMLFPGMYKGTAVVTRAMPDGGADTRTIENLVEIVP